MAKIQKNREAETIPGISGNYRMTFDYHTHTTFSHGKGSIEDNVLAARERGLSAVAVTDHGPGHLTYGIKRDSVPVMRVEIERLKRCYPDMGIYLGVEANTVNTENGLDVTRAEVEGLYDFVLAGYHYGVLRGYCLQNFLWAHTAGRGRYAEQAGGDGAQERKKSKLLTKNTELVLRALYENPIKILTHPGDKGPFDMEALAKACGETGAWMEISTWHPHLTVDEIRIAARRDVKFVVSSDAHTPNRVGSFAGGVQRALAAGLEIERIVNIERV